MVGKRPTRLIGSRVAVMVDSPEMELYGCEGGVGLVEDRKCVTGATAFEVNGVVVFGEGGCKCFVEFLSRFVRVDCFGKF